MVVITVEGQVFVINTHCWLGSLSCSVVSEGGRISVNSGREKVSLTLDSSTRGDNGTWTCSAQVYDSEDQTVGQPVERTVQLVVVCEL